MNLNIPILFSDRFWERLASGNMIRNNLKSSIKGLEKYQNTQNWLLCNINMELSKLVVEYASYFKEGLEDTRDEMQLEPRYSRNY